MSCRVESGACGIGSQSREVGVVQCRCPLRCAPADGCLAMELWQAHWSTCSWRTFLATGETEILVDDDTSVYPYRPTFRGARIYRLARTRNAPQLDRAKARPAQKGRSRGNAMYAGVPALSRPSMSIPDRRVCFRVISACPGFSQIPRCRSPPFPLLVRCSGDGLLIRLHFFRPQIV